MTRDTLLLLIVGLPVLGMANGAFFGMRLKSFLDETRELASSSHMDRYKEQVKAQMYAALVQIVLLGAPSLLWMIGIGKDELGVGDLLYVIVPSAIMIGIGVAFKKVEEKARNIQTADELRGERERVVARWMGSAFPDW